jgi:hypothetical protein
LLPSPPHLILSWGTKLQTITTGERLFRNTVCYSMIVPVGIKAGGKLMSLIYVWEADRDHKQESDGVGKYIEISSNTEIVLEKMKIGSGLIPDRWNAWSDLVAWLRTGHASCNTI